MSGFGQGLYDVFAPDFAAIGEAWSGFLGKMRGWVGSVAEAMGVDGDAARAAFDRLFDFSGVIARLNSIKAAVSEFFSNLFSAETLTDGDRADVSEAGRRIGEDLGRAIRDAISSFAGFGQLIIDKILIGLDGAWTSVVAWFEGKIASLGKLLTFDVDFNLPDTSGLFGGLFGGDEPQPAGPPSLGAIYQDLEPNGKQAAGEIRSGAEEAGGALGRKARRELASGAEDAGRSFGRAAAAEIERASANVNVNVSGGGANGRSSRAISSAKTGAFHDGVD